MILVDTSVWASHFNGADNGHVRRLTAAFDAREDLCVIPIIVTEVLQGFRGELGFETARRVLLDLPVLTVDMDGYVRAAQLFRTLRSRGITIRGAIDCLIAQACLDFDCEVLSSDTDFGRIASALPLRLCRI